jgi:hypothetical protein
MLSQALTKQLVNQPHNSLSLAALMVNALIGTLADEAYTEKKVLEVLSKAFFGIGLVSFSYD